MLPRYQKQGVSSAKNVEKQSMTHAEFMAFIEPFCELVKEKNFEELGRLTAPKNLVLKKEVYTRMDEHLRERLCSSFVFSDDIEVDCIEFDTELTLKRSVRSPGILSSVFERHNVLEHYRAPEYKAMQREYEQQVEVNNARRLAIASSIRKRIRFQAYFYAYDIMHAEIDELAKKMKMRKRKGISEVDAEAMREYLRRIEEFHDAFGTPDQFSDSEANHSDILTPSEGTLDPSMMYFV